jgi:hypothetical protein
MSEQELRKGGEEEEEKRNMLFDGVWKLTRSAADKFSN